MKQPREVAGTDFCVCGRHRHGLMCPKCDKAFYLCVCREVGA